MSVGTYIHPLLTEPMLAYALFPYLTDEEITGVTTLQATLTGPPGWNGDEVLEFTVSAELLADGFGWYAHDAAVPGNYTLEMDTGSGVYTATASLPSTDVVVLPTGVQVGDHDSTSVAGAWDPHPTAVSYTVLLYQGPHASPTVVAAAYTLDTTYEFTGLTLPAGDYFFAVRVMPVDQTAEHRLLPPERFDVALNATDLFQIE